MPFTAAHPALVLPFLRWQRASATGLICGAIVPDFENFLRLHTGEEFTHSLPGLFLVDVPGAILLAFVFHVLVKEALLSNLPAFLTDRLTPMQALDFKCYWRQHRLRFIVSACFGAATHLMWDSLTHNSQLVQVIPIYQRYSLPLYGVDYPLFHVLQQASTIIGLLFVLTYILQQPRLNSISTLKSKAWYWPIVLTVTILIFYLRFAWASEQAELGNVVVTMITGILAGVIFSSLILYGRKISLN